MINYIDSFRGSVVSSFKGDGSEAGEIAATFLLFHVVDFYRETKLNHSNVIYLLSDAAFNNIETALLKYDDGPFFLGQFSLVSNDFHFVPKLMDFTSFIVDVDVDANGNILTVN